MNDSFVEFLEGHKKESYFLIAAPGNSGDALLRKGLELYLKENKYKIVAEISDADNILIHGGANISDVWEVGITLLKSIIKDYPSKKIIIAPHSCYFSKTDFEKILNSCKQEIHFFTREKYSFERLKKMDLNQNIHLYLANDTAFLLENSDYISELKKKSGNKHILFSFRIDSESQFLNKKILKLIEVLFGRLGPREVVERFYHKQFSRKFIKKNLLNQCQENKIIITDTSLRPYNIFVDLISSASEIYTDRLHVGILGALLEKKVYFYAASYKKLEGVYEQTLKKYPSVIKRF